MLKYRMLSNHNHDVRNRGAYSIVADVELLSPPYQCKHDSLCFRSQHNIVVATHSVLQQVHCLSKVLRVAICTVLYRHINMLHKSFILSVMCACPNNIPIFIIFIVNLVLLGRWRPLWTQRLRLRKVGHSPSFSHIQVTLV